MKIISRAEAKSRGSKTFFTGKPCKRGHQAERYSANGSCLECAAGACRRYYEENREAIKESTRLWRGENRERAKELCRRWHEENRDRHLKRCRRWREENKERESETGFRWRMENKERKAEAGRRWYKENKERHKENGLRWHRHQRATNPDFRMAEAMRGMLRRTLENKNDRSSEHLGYTAEELRKHLEKQFTKGMSWGNYGDWHVDHIVPVAEHIKSGQTDPAIINCLTNLRPIWAKENLSKSSKRHFLL